MSTEPNRLQNVIQGQPVLGPESTFYKFSMCNVQTFYIEVPSWCGLADAVQCLKSEFGIDVDEDCHGCAGRRLHKVEVVAEQSVPQPDNLMTFVGCSTWCRCQ